MELDFADTEALLAKNEEPHFGDLPPPPHAAPVGGHRVEFKDRAFAIAFAANLGGVLFVALFFGLPNVFHLYFTIHGDGPSPSDSTVSHGLRIFSIFVLTSCVGGGISVLWLQMLQRYASDIINFTLRGSIVALLVSSAISFLDSGLGGRAVGFVNLFSAIWIFMYYASIRQTIGFAASNLAAASRILCEFPNIVSTAYVALVIQAVWTLIWSIAVIGVLAKSTIRFHDATDLGNVSFFFMLLSLFWFIEVVKNIVHCVTAGAVGEWWFGMHDATTVQRSRIRAATFSLGSICLGSLVIAVLSASKAVLLSAPRRKGRRSPNACLECIIKFVSNNIQYFNKYAFCHVAIYGKDFQSAGYDTMRVFRDRGWSSIINDTLISNVLTVGALVVGATSGAIGSAWVFMTMECTAEEIEKHPGKCETFNVVVLTFVACAAIGYAMCAIVSSVLESIVSTIFVCFAEDPVALQQAHPEEHRRLVDAWRRLKPDLLAHPTHAGV